MYVYEEVDISKHVGHDELSKYVWVEMKHFDYECTNATRTGHIMQMYVLVCIRCRLYILLTQGYDQD